MKLTIPFEVKAAQGRKISGHGSVFGNVDLGGDVVVPGAFRKSLDAHAQAGTMPAMLWQHDHTQPVGAWTSIDEDEKGLPLEGELADTALGRDVHTLAKMRAVRGLSIGFEIEEFDFDKRGVRFIEKANLWEVSIVTFPMNPKAVIETVKSQFPDPRSLERYLREQGCPRKAARDVVHDLLDSSVMLEDDAPCEADPDVIEAAKALQSLFIVGQLRPRRI